MNSSAPMDNRTDPPTPLKTANPPGVSTPLKCHMVAETPGPFAITLCGIAAGPGPVSVTSERESVTCAKCIELMGD